MLGSYFHDFHTEGPENELFIELLLKVVGGDNCTLPVPISARQQEESLTVMFNMTFAMIDLFYD